MNLRKRLISLEEAQTAELKNQPSKLDIETHIRLLNDLVLCLNDGKHTARHWVVRPVPSNIGPIGAKLHNILNKLSEQQ